ncbi:MAG: hypothetical protein WA173_14255 [Pseudomonas sp.]|uniref:DUF6945 domain-containing protein n=1 Tax=Pseudomonas sp. TaxID=306 RepID=UPI003BB6B0D3
MSNEQFIMIPDVLAAATDYISPNTGELISLNFNQKYIYLLIQNRWRFFTSQKQRHYDTQEYFVGRSGMAVRTIRTIIKGFKDSGLITTFDEKGFNGFNKTIYKTVKEIKLPVVKAASVEVVEVAPVAAPAVVQVPAKPKPKKKAVKGGFDCPMPPNPRSTVERFKAGKLNTYVEDDGTDKLFYEEG